VTEDGQGEVTDDPYADLRAATPTEGWDAERAPDSGASTNNAYSDPPLSPRGRDASTEPTDHTQTPLGPVGQRKRLSWHGDTRDSAREASSSRGLRSTLSALRLNSWGGDSDAADSTVRLVPRV
jgi:hypothetical protein